MTGRPTEISGQMPSSFDSTPEFHNERAMQKVFRKVKEEPLVPLGIGLTVAAFINAYRALRRGDSKQANRMFRARVAAQGFTVVAMVAGSMYYSQDRAKTKELRELQSQRDAEEKRVKWIRELEARDEEDKAMRSLVQKKVAERNAAAAAAASSSSYTENDAAAPAEKSGGGGGGGGGGMLGNMGLWSEGEKKAAEAQEAAAQSGKSRKENPKSSLGALGEILASQKKDEGKKDDGEPK
ncbi:Hypoxia induced protein conserved region, partial [Geosmithia morbida]